MNLSILHQLKSLSLEAKVIVVSTFVLLIMIPITIWAVNVAPAETSPEAFASECSNAQASASWPSTPGCLVNKNVSWNSVPYDLKIYYPKNLDRDRDGFSNDQEDFIGTNGNDKCSWPPDINGDGSVAITDIGLVVNAFGTAEGDSDYSARRDLNADGSISIIDIGRVVQFFGGTCDTKEDIPLSDITFASTTYNSPNFVPKSKYTWEVCYPNCTNPSYSDSGSASSNADGRLTFSWTGITYIVTAFDQGCGSPGCQVPGSTANVTGTSTTVRDLYPNRNHKLFVCYRSCQENQVQVVTFTSPNCSGSGGRYSVIITNNNSTNPIQAEVTNLSGTFRTFSNLKANTDYDFYVYSPSVNHSRIYKKGGMRSNAGTCEMSESDMQAAIHFNINLKRGQNNRPNLSINNTMVTAARVRSREAIQSFSHTRPDGRPSSSVMGDHGLSYTYYGEILGRNNYPDDVDSINVVINGWMDSSGHRDAILNSNFTQMGAGVIKHSDGWNYYAVEFRKP